MQIFDAPIIASNVRSFPSRKAHRVPYIFVYGQFKLPICVYMEQLLSVFFQFIKLTTRTHSLTLNLASSTTNAFQVGGTPIYPVLLPSSLVKVLTWLIFALTLDQGIILL